MRHLSPRALADALGVSESSLKRWVDAGKIVSFRTDGGHRRIALDDAVRFIRETRAPLARPELLGLPAAAVVERAGSPELVDLLREGDVEGTRGLLLSRYLAGATTAELADGPIRDAMHALGELWLHDERGVFIEHRATDACLQAIAHLRGMLAAPVHAPIALGAGPEDDPYLIAPLLASMVTTDAGFRTINLGPDTPLAALQEAALHHRPRLIWLSVSSPLHPARARAISRWLASVHDAAVVVGGRHGKALAGGHAGIRYLATMTELAALASKLASARAASLPR